MGGSSSKHSSTEQKPTRYDKHRHIQIEQVYAGVSKLPTDASITDFVNKFYVYVTETEPYYCEDDRMPSFIDCIYVADSLRTANYTIGDNNDLKGDSMFVLILALAHGAMRHHVKYISTRDLNSNYVYVSGTTDVVYEKSNSKMKYFKFNNSDCVDEKKAIGLAELIGIHCERDRSMKRKPMGRVSDVHDPTNLIPATVSSAMSYSKSQRTDLVRWPFKWEQFNNVTDLESTTRLAPHGDTTVASRSWLNTGFGHSYFYEIDSGYNLLKYARPSIDATHTGTRVRWKDKNGGVCNRLLFVFVQV